MCLFTNKVIFFKLTLSSLYIEIISKWKFQKIFLNIIILKTTVLQPSLRYVFWIFCRLLTSCDSLIALCPQPCLKKDIYKKKNIQKWAGILYRWVNYYLQLISNVFSFNKCIFSDLSSRTKINRPQPQENKSQQNKGVPPGIKCLKMSISSFFYNISKIYDWYKRRVNS